MSRDLSKEQIGSFLTVSVFSGLITGIGLLFTLLALGLPRLEAMVFAALSGFTLGAFIFRERSLTHSNDRMRETHRFEVAQLEQRIHYYYDHSLVCLAFFDVGSLLIDKVSPGFLQLLRIPPELDVRGKSIVELLSISPSRMETIVIEAQRERTSVKAHNLIVEDSLGSQLPVEVTAEYFKMTHMVEAAFFASPREGSNDIEEVDIALKDLDRFRRGMYRRETRILELKEEVNEILKAAGKEARYRFDQKTEDTHIPGGDFSDSEGAQ